MFTGIIQEVGKIKSIIQKGNARILTIASVKLINEIKPGDSVSVNGVCLTVVEKSNNSFKVEAVEETIKKTNLGKLKNEDPVNLELALKLGERIGGHLVTGHIDTTGKIKKIKKLPKSWLFEINFPKQFRKYIINTGSIAVDGISLTVADIDDDTFTVSIIPYTWKNTNFKFKKVGDEVNLEFDFFGKYIENFLKTFKAENYGKKDKILDRG
jgi:riboflavin synthase